MFFFSISGFSQVLLEGFEGTSTPNLTTDQWVLTSGTWGVFDNGVGTGQSWKPTSSAALVFEGSRAALKEREYNGPAGSMSRDYLATPAVTVPTNGQLRFYTRLNYNGDTGARFKILVAPATGAQNDPAGYTQIQEWTEVNLVTVFNVYEEKAVDLSAYANQSVYVAFMVEFTQPQETLSGDNWYIDKVRIVEKCLTPTVLAAGSITQSSALLSWANPSGATQFEVQVIPFTATPTGVGVLTTTNSYAANGTTTPVGPFAPSTQYKYYVRALCSTTTADTVPSDWAGPFPFTTSAPGMSCGSAIVIPPTLPFTVTSNTSNYGDTTDVPQPAGCAGTATNFMTGNDVFYSFTPTTSGAISITMTPTGTRSAIFVYEGCSNVGVTCLAGVADTGTTIRVIPSLAVTAGQTYIIVISSATAPQTVGYTLNIQTLNCAAPTFLSAVGTGPSSANLSWQNPGGASAWEVFVQSPGAAMPTTAGTTANTNTNFGVTTLTATGAPLTLGQYQYWVRAACGDGTFSPWAGPYIFNTTSCASGCNYTFVVWDSWGDGWNGNTMKVTQGTQTVATLTGPTAAQGTTPINVSVPMCDGPFQLFWNSGGSFPGEVGVSIINSFGQTIYTKAPGTGSANTALYTGVVDCLNPVCLPPTNLTASGPTTDGASLNWTSVGAPTSWQIFAVPTGSAPPTDASTPTVTIPSSTLLPYLITGLLSDTTYTYYVRSVCSGSGPNPWSAVSPPFTTLPTCPKPTGPILYNASETTIDLNWVAGGSETTWQYIILPVSAPAPTAATPGWVTTTEKPVTIEGLTSGTTYKAYVVAVCSPTDSSTIAGPANGSTTICPPASQCLYTFTVRDSWGDGWNGGVMTVVQNGVVVATFTGPTNAQGTTPINIQVPLCSGVPFSLFWNTAGTFPNEIGVSITSFLGEVIYTKAPGTGSASTAVPLFTGTGECAPPTCFKPINVSVNSTGMNSAMVAWADTNTVLPPSWDILVLPANAPAPLNNATGWVNATTNPFTVTGLTAATQYKVYVRAVCSDSDSSYWSLGTPFNTTVCAPDTLCEYSFIMVDTGANGWTGNTMNIVQNGIIMATLTGPVAANGTNPITQIVSLCNNVPFQLVWNAGGTQPAQVGITIRNQTGVLVYTKNPGTGSQNSTLFNGTVTCIPYTCPKPTQVVATDVTATSAMISWIESGSATDWEVLVMPFGSPAPTTIGIPTGNPYLITGLAPGTPYTVYVRAVCSASDISQWSIRYDFATPPTNDNCENAMFVPTNQGLTCIQEVSATLIGATGSPQNSACGGTANDDVWFYFTATASSHIISITGLTGLNYAVYGGNCDALTQISCVTNLTNQPTIPGLVIGNIYRIRVYSVATTPLFTGSFKVCIRTVPCSTATPFCTGQVLTYPNATGILPGLGSMGCLGSSPNPAFFFLQVNQAGQLNYLMTQSTTPGGTPNLDVDYALWGPFTSNEAACAVVPNDNPLRCSFSANNTENFSIPNAQLCQIYVVMITNYSDDPGFITFRQTNTTGGGTTACYPFNTFNYSANAYCQSAPNPSPILVTGAAAGTYTATPAGLSIDPVTGVINLAASTPGNYLVTSTTIPTTGGVCPSIPNITTVRSVTINAVPSATISYGAAIPQFCNSISTAQNVTQTGTIGGTYSSTNGLFINPINGTIIPSVSTPGLYTVTYTIPAVSGCSIYTTTTQVEIINSPIVPYINDVVVCDSYTLPALTVGNYFTGTGGTGTPLSAGDPITATQTLYVYASSAACSSERSFLITINQTPAIVPIANVNTCSPYALLPLSAGNYYTGPNGTGTMLNAGDIISTDQTLYVYGANGTCSSEVSFTLTFGVLVVTTPGDQIVCDSYILPVLPVGNYYTATNGAGSQLAVGSSVTNTQTIYVYGNSGSCTDEDSFLVTVNPTPVVAAVAPVVTCGSYTLPALAVGNYFTASGGTGTQLNAGDVLTTDQTVYVYAQTGTGPICSDEESFTITISTPPVLAPIANVAICDSYTLPALATGNYFTAPNGGGTPLFVNNTITATQTIYVYAELGTCSAEEQFDVVITDTPEFIIAGECQGTSFVLEGTAVNGYVFPADAIYSWTAGPGGIITGSTNTLTTTVSGIATYNLTVTSGNCSQTLPFLADNTTCTIQKGISPNGDGLNDNFNLEGQNVAKLQIFNRYGTAVYEKNNYTNQWYGQTDKGEELPDGTYYFVINRANGETKTGWIYINRERN